MHRNSKPILTPREIIDPDETLPDIDLVVDPDKKQPSGTLLPIQMSILHHGEKIGKATLVHDISAKEAHFAGVTIEESFRGKGFGMATYLAAIENAHGNGETFRTHDWSQTEAAVKVWTKFIDAGIAEVIEPLTPFMLEHDGQSELVYSGHIEIKPTSTN